MGKDKLHEAILILAGIAILLATSCKKEETFEPIGRKSPFTSYGMPTLWIDTEDGVAISSKFETVPCTIKLTEDGDDEDVILTQSARIRGRGNATWWWDYPKRPYKIKLDKAQSLCGMPSNRDWALLALYSDHTLMRESFMTCIASKLDMPYQIRQEYVRVVLNGQENGVYVLSETVENAKNRIDVKSDGFIIEKDNHAENESVVFYSGNGHCFTFKYPDNGDIDNGDLNYTYIKDFIDSFENALYGSDFKDPDKGYRKYIEPRSFAKWYLLQEISDNWEPNPFYVLQTRGALLEAGPTWDAEWSFGLSRQDQNGWMTPPAQPDPESGHWHQTTYLRNLFEDPYFVDIVREEWSKLKPKLQQVHEEMATLAESLDAAQKYNFKLYPILGTVPELGLVCFGNWKDEVAYADDYLTKHAAWFDSWIAEK